jgi:hypothetical protein
MQKQLKLMLLFTVASFIIFTGFKRDNPVSSSVNSKAKRTPVTITAVYDFSTFPNVSGTFTTGGALTISGTTTMDIDQIVPGSIFHCVITLIASNGTITIHQECEFATNPPSGQWQIVSGTGAYANLKGNGSLLMPPDTEAMEGFIY